MDVFIIFSPLYDELISERKPFMEIAKSIGVKLPDCLIPDAKLNLFANIQKIENSN